MHNCINQYTMSLWSTLCFLGNCTILWKVLFFTELLPFVKQTDWNQSWRQTFNIISMAEVWNWKLLKQEFKQITQDSNYSTLVKLSSSNWRRQTVCRVVLSIDLFYFWAYWQTLLWWRIVLKKNFSLYKLVATCIYLLSCKRDVHWTL